MPLFLEVISFSRVESAFEEQSLRKDNGLVRLNSRPSAQTRRFKITKMKAVTKKIQDTKAGFAIYQSLLK